MAEMTRTITNTAQYPTRSPIIRGCIEGKAQSAKDLCHDSAANGAPIHPAMTRISRDRPRLAPKNIETRITRQIRTDGAPVGLDFTTATEDSAAVSTEAQSGTK
ncbi:hypothetical protein AOE01nite_19980 [Acetobacter oeni]|uniref:Uncharacterized protein n=1 Tax=Acetobacter oeni TaxID=304077 RepID=A0A511XLH8_9PROT|nr:hypothetical protein AOE01nite_19980 [Acetobacter oeni]